MRTLLLVCSILALCGILFAAESPLVGTWKLVSTGPEEGQEMVWKMTVTETDGKLAITVVGDMGEYALENLKVEDDILTGNLSIEGGTYSVTLKVNGNTAEGTWKGTMGEGGTLKAEKQ